MKSPIKETGSPLTVSPLVGGLGAEIGGVELSQPLGDDAVAAIRHALLTHLVVFFRDQSLSPSGLVDFGGVSARSGDIRSSTGFAIIPRSSK